MNVDTGHIHPAEEVRTMSRAERRLMEFIPPTELKRVRAMGAEARKAWAAEKRETKAAARNKRKAARRARRLNR